MIIYKTTNIINGKIYIGQSTIDDLNYFGSGLLLTRAIKKYGILNFKKEILETCKTKKDLDVREKYWIKYLNSTDKKIGYNISHGGTGGKLVDVDGKKGKTYEEYYGIEKARQIKEKFSKVRKGKKLIYKNTTAKEVGQKIRNALKGRKIQKEHKNKISKSLKIYYKTDAGINQINNLIKNRVGKKQTYESNMKRHLTMKGKRPKILDVHPSAKYWYFYDKNNNLILKTLGDYVKTLKNLKTNFRRVVVFTNLSECMEYLLEPKKDYKIFTEKYYNGNN